MSKLRAKSVTISSKKKVVAADVPTPDAGPKFHLAALPKIDATKLSAEITGEVNNSITDFCADLVASISKQVTPDTLNKVREQLAKLIQSVDKKVDSLAQELSTTVNSTFGKVKL